MSIFDIFKKKGKKQPKSSGGPRGQTGDRERSDKKIKDLVANKNKYQHKQIAGDNRNEYQMRMHALKTGKTFDPSKFTFTDVKGNQVNPGSDSATRGNASGAQAYADKFPIANFLQEGLPKILTGALSLGNPIGIAGQLAKYIYESEPGQNLRGMVGDTIIDPLTSGIKKVWNSEPSQNLRGMARDTIIDPLTSGINNTSIKTEDVLASLQKKMNEWNVSQGKKANPDFIPNKLTDTQLRDQFPFDFNEKIVREAMGNWSHPIEKVEEEDIYTPSGKSSGPYDSGFETTEEVVEPLAELSENERIIQDYKQEFLDTYGVPMQGNKEVASLAEPGTKIYGLGDPNTRSAMLTKNNLRNYEFGKTPDINPLTGLLYGYDDDIFASDDIFSDTISDVSPLPKTWDEIITNPKLKANGGYMSNFPNQNMGTQSLTASDNIDDRIMKNLQYEKMAPGMMGYNQGGKAMGIYEKLKSFNDHG